MEESKLNIGCIRFLKMDKDSMSCAHSNKSRVVERLASRASEIESARCSSFRGVRNLTERKEFDPNFFRGLSAPIVGIFESTWGASGKKRFWMIVILDVRVGYRGKNDREKFHGTQKRRRLLMTTDDRF